MTKTACITGVTGQTGSILCEKLLGMGYKVYGLRRRSSSFNTERLNSFYQDVHINNQLELVYGDLTDAISVTNFIADIKPDYLFHLGAMSNVRISFDIPLYTAQSIVEGTINCLEAVRKYSPKTRMVHASTSEQFGNSMEEYQNESTPFRPVSPYGIAKTAAHTLMKNYRESYNLFCANSISFNHEGPKRNEVFVTRKIIRGATRIAVGLQDKIYLGNTSAKRDWSDARNICDALVLIANADEPDDFCVASGETRTVQEFIEITFGKLGLDWKNHIEIDPRYYRPVELSYLKGDSSKIKNKLGWEPKISFDQMVDDMIENDLKLAQQEKLLKI